MTEILILIAGVLALVYFSYSAGKNKEKIKSGEVFINAIKKAKAAKRKLTDPEYRRMLRLKYKK